jgi:hypothetical protein
MFTVSASNPPAFVQHSSSPHKNSTGLQLWHHRDAHNGLNGGGGGGVGGPTVCYLFPSNLTCTAMLHSPVTYLNKSCTIFKHFHHISPQDPKFIAISITSPSQVHVTTMLLLLLTAEN